MKEPLLFWAHDDTVEVDKTYRYRVRLGVFNPVAGTGQVSEKYRQMRDQIILWSNFAQATEIINVAAKSYFFPLEIPSAGNNVRVKVCKYFQGYWYAKDYNVKQGEAIGRVEETQKEQTQKEKESQETTEAALPESIDYSTSVVLLDFIPVSDWTSAKNAKERFYYNMLYSQDGLSINRMAVGSKNWPERIVAAYNEILRLEKEPREAFRERGSRGGAGGGIRGVPPGMMMPGGDGFDDLRTRRMILEQGTR